MGLDDRGYMRDRYRRRQGLPPSSQQSGFKDASASASEIGSTLIRTLLIGGLAVLTPFVLTKVYTDTLTAQFQTMIPIPFPKSGSVYVTKSADLQRRQGLVRLKADGYSASAYFVLFHDSDTDKDILGIYLRGGDNIAVPVPVGRYRVRVANGNAGHWRGVDRLFGTTAARELLDTVRVTVKTDRTLDLEASGGRPLELKHNSNVGFVD